jgi:hypothetical protein
MQSALESLQVNTNGESENIVYTRSVRYYEEVRLNTTLHAMQSAMESLQVNMNGESENVEYTRGVRYSLPV